MWVGIYGPYRSDSQISLVARCIITEVNPLDKCSIKMEPEKRPLNVEMDDTPSSDTGSKFWHWNQGHRSHLRTGLIRWSGYAEAPANRLPVFRSRAWRPYSKTVRDRCRHDSGYDDKRDLRAGSLGLSQRVQKIY
jgi:hypothetical protein